ncbi:MAG: hypothetical protein KGO96_05890 [Elusimicrobia bacterium]|nr:hypothetical protein [Elusimicrobiota bacterium]MDE2425421.1 hypothetical protein [Elusimicrobiota bacterium]
MRRLDGFWLWAAALCLGACVSVGETPMAGHAIQRGQRVLLLVYAAPGPLVREQDNKAESAAKIVPGLGLLVEQSQEERDLKASQALGRYLPSWDPAAELDAVLRPRLAALGLPGPLLASADTKVAPSRWARLNAASDVMDWRRRYVAQSPGTPSVGRDYSKLLTLDGDLVLEVDLSYGLDDLAGDGLAYAPGLDAVVKLVRADTAHRLWFHEESLSDKAGARSLYDFERQPADLLASWKRLLPELSAQLADSLRQSLSGPASQ